MFFLMEKYVQYDEKQMVLRLFLLLEDSSDTLLSSPLFDQPIIVQPPLILMKSMMSLTLSYKFYKLMMLHKTTQLLLQNEFVHSKISVETYNW